MKIKVTVRFCLPSERMIVKRIKYREKCEEIRESLHTLFDVCIGVKRIMRIVWGCLKNL